MANYETRRQSHQVFDRERVRKKSILVVLEMPFEEVDLQKKQIFGDLFLGSHVGRIR